MPHSTRLSTPIPRSYLSNMWLNSVDDPLARETFFRMKLACDNLGRLPGDPGMVSGVLFPGNPPPRTKMTKVLETLAKCRLIFWYEVSRQQFIEICDTGITQKLVGFMTDESDYPPPPQRMVEKWESFTGQKREIVKNLNRSKRVYTGTNRDEPVQTGIDGQSRLGKGQSQIEQSREDSDFAKTANAIVPSTATAEEKARAREERTYGEAIMSPTLATDLHILTSGHFDRDIGLQGYNHADEFLAVIRSCFESRREIPLGGRKESADFMGHVVNACQQQGFKAPPGWIKALSECRREVRNS
jgi:hypothetical protein